MKFNAKVLGVTAAFGLLAACNRYPELELPSPLSDTFNKTDQCIELNLDGIARTEHAKNNGSVALHEPIVMPVIESCIAQEGQEPVYYKPDRLGHYVTGIVYDESYFKMPVKNKVPGPE